jgi:type II secretory pathway component PulF
MNATLAKIQPWKAAMSASWRLSKPWRRDPEPCDNHAMLKVLQVANAGQLPIDSLLEAYAREQSFSQARLVRKVVELVRSGTPAIAALEQVPGLLNDEQLLSLRFASQSGNLPATLQRLTNQQAAVIQDEDESTESNLVYWLSVAIVIIVMWAFMMLFIWPTFRELGTELEDTSLVKPASVMVYAWTVCVSFWPICLLFLIGCIVLLFSSRLQRFLLAKTRPFVRGRSKRVNPITFELLASSVETGKPLLSGMSTLGKYHYDPLSRQRMLVARNEVEQGADEIDGMQTAAVLDSNEADALRAFNTPEGKAFVLRSIAERDRNQERSRDYRRGVLVAPVIAIALGVPVLWICGSFFYMLTQLISALS